MVIVFILRAEVWFLASQMKSLSLLHQSLMSDAQCTEVIGESIKYIVRCLSSAGTIFGKIINFFLGALSNHRRACCKSSQGLPNGQTNGAQIKQTGRQAKKTRSPDRSNSMIILDGFLA